MRHRVSIQDLGLLAAALLVVGFLAFEFDFYVTQSSKTLQEKAFELDELLTLGGLLAVGLLAFATRRYVEQKRETRRRILAEQEARVLAYQDALTGLPNRRRFDDALAAAIAAPPAAGKSHALFLLDLNGFKRINDVHGHGVGDEVLAVVAKRLPRAVREGDLVSRFGGDEFAVLAEHLLGAEAAMSIALRIMQSLEEPITVGTTRHQVGTGIGIALIPADARTPQEALRKADVALYRAKVEQRSALRFFEPEMDRHIREREQMERALRGAVAAGNIRPRFRPVVELRTGRVVAFKATPHWRHPALGEIPAERFLPIAEATGLIHTLAERVLRLCCEAAAAWPEEVVLSLDLHAGQLREQALAARIAAILHEGGLASRRLELEIAESMLVQDLQPMQQALEGLRTAGIRIALGNFGTGYSSLFHLRNFKLDKIKIDRSFVESIRSDEESVRIVSALVGLGRGLGLTVMADGIQAPEQQAALIETGCEQGEGFLFSEAVPAEETGAFFRARHAAAGEAFLPASEVPRRI